MTAPLTDLEVIEYLRRAGASGPTVWHLLSHADRRSENTLARAFYACDRLTLASARFHYGHLAAPWDHPLYTQPKQRAVA